MKGSDCLMVFCGSAQHDSSASARSLRYSSVRMATTMTPPPHPLTAPLSTSTTSTVLAMTNSYRRALSTEPFKTIARRTGVILLSGQDEAGFLTSSLLAMDLPARKPIPAEEVMKPKKAKKGAAAKDKKEGKSKKGGKESESGSPVPSATPTSPDTPAGPGGLARQQSAMTMDSEAMGGAGAGYGDDMLGDMQSEGMQPSLGASVVGDAAAQIRAAQEASARDRAEYQLELRALLLGAIVRLARRVCWSYCRQLWDDNYAELQQEDEESEKLFEAVSTKKQLYTVQMQCVITCSVLCVVSERERESE
jgi:hypothetical protein